MDIPFLFSFAVMIFLGTYWFPHCYKQKKFMQIGILSLIYFGVQVSVLSLKNTLLFAFFGSFAMILSCIFASKIIAIRE